jgi:Family of unknown function (DUF695)
MAGDDTWVIASTEEEGLRVLFRYRAMVPPGIAPSDYPHLINIYWQFDGSATAGMPASNVADRMSDFENLLEPIEGPRLGFLMLAITGNSRKEWIWYARQPDAFLAAVTAALLGAGEFPIEFEAAADQHWDNYRGLLASVDETPH